QQLDSIIRKNGNEVERVNNSWRFTVVKRMLLCITDENSNRMRIISPIVEIKELDSVYLSNALIANFHSALDVKYAISDDILWSVFAHPLKELTQDQVSDAIRQVFNAAATFGDSYSSTDMFFPGNTPQD
ncbi:MAG: hypothetical protein RQ756_09375, partial [Flavobacteriaceae bacterium]|nr:hypothetical protein [Flavobacteriaceae bacterium]